MTHSFVTVAIPFAADKAGTVDGLLEQYALPLRDTNSKIRTALRRQKLHFMSITIVPGDIGKCAHLVLEGTVDGTDDTFFKVLSSCIPDDVVKILAAAGLTVAKDRIASELRKFQVKTGYHLFSTPGLGFAGTPGMAVDRIRDEYDLARAVRTYLDKNILSGSSLQNLRKVRDHIAGIEPLRPLLAPIPVTPLPADATAGSLDPKFLLTLALPAIVTFFWPLLLILAALVVAATWVTWSYGVAVAVAALFGSLLLALVSLALTIYYLYRRVRGLENSNRPDNSLPDRAVLDDVTRHEDWGAQNHFAGWVLLPNTDKLLFFSNYGGSWGSYLEDFITKAANGLTGVWSNTVGFPKTENLFTNGAKDGERFKYWARRQQQPTR